MLGQHRRRWPNIETTLDQRRVFTGSPQNLNQVFLSGAQSLRKAARQSATQVLFAASLLSLFAAAASTWAQQAPTERTYYSRECCSNPLTPTSTKALSARI